MYQFFSFWGSVPYLCTLCIYDCSNRILEIIINKKLTVFKLKERKKPRHVDVVIIPFHTRQKMINYNLPDKIYVVKYQKL